MFELDKYAGAVYSSWGITLGLVALLAVISWRQSVKAKADMEAAEARKAARNG